MLIALQGYKGSGKDYIASLIAKKMNAKTIAFADPLKKMIMDTYKLETVEQYDQFKRTVFDIGGKQISGRDIVRDTGMFVKNADPSFFIREARKQVENCADLIITDLRFNDELEAVLDWGGIVCTVLGGWSDGHITETLPLRVDCSEFIFDNRMKDDSILDAISEFCKMWS